MSLIIKSLETTAPEGAKKLYRDALVSKGSLILVDFSNKGTTDNFSIDGSDHFYNLAREASEPLGVKMDGSISRTGNGPGAMTDGRGVDLYAWLGSFDKMRFGTGVTDYLYQNQPHSVMTFWARTHPTARDTGVRLLGVTTEEDVALHTGSIGSVLSGFETPTLTFGGTGISGNDYTYTRGELVQLAVEFNGVGNPVRRFLNGDFHSEGNISDGFDGDITALNIGAINSLKTDAAIYRLLIEDLSVSGRTAEEVVKQDWDYVNATGVYEGIPKRPFVDIY